MNSCPRDTWGMSGARGTAEVGSGRDMPGILPKLLTLAQAAQQLGTNASIKVLRAEVHAGRLKCYRLRPGPNAKILISETELARWLEEVAGRRQLAFRQR